MIFPDIKQEREYISKHYDELDTLYRQLWGEHLHHGLWKSGKESKEDAVLALIELAAEKAQIKSGSKVCDIGCGYGATARFLAQKWQASLTGFTISEKQYLYAKAQGGSPNYHLQDWLENTLPASSYDAAISIECSEHMPDKKRFFEEAYRILKPKGRLVITAWLAKEQPKNYEVNWLLEPICRESRLPSLANRQEYIDLIQKAGFTHIEYSDLSSQVKKTWTVAFWNLLKSFFQNKSTRDYLLSNSAKNRSFVKTILRMRLGFYLESIRYGMFCAEKQ